MRRWVMGVWHSLFICLVQFNRKRLCSEHKLHTNCVCNRVHLSAIRLSNSVLVDGARTWSLIGRVHLLRTVCIFTRHAFMLYTLHPVCAAPSLTKSWCLLVMINVNAIKNHSYECFTLSLSRLAAWQSHATPFKIPHSYSMHIAQRPSSHFFSCWLRFISPADHLVRNRNES